MMGNDDHRANRVGTELLSWAMALVIAAPLGVGFWFVLRQLPAPWDTAYPVLAILPLLVIGLLSKSNVWTLLVWLIPLVALQLLFVAGVRGFVLASGSVMVLAWVAGLMFFESFSAAVFRALEGVFQSMVMGGLSRQKRDAYRGFRGASLWTAKQREDAGQLADIARTVRAFREPGLRIGALSPPDPRWAEVFEASAVSFLRAAEMFESGQPVDYEAVNQMVVRRQQLIHLLLRDESLPYRILTFVPGSLLRR
jgi:hypothetical protein